MTPQSQKDEIKRSFQKVFRGYDPSEVDSYINALTENYNALYRDYAELEHKLSEANDKLSDITGEEEKVKFTHNVVFLDEKIIDRGFPFLGGAVFRF